MRRINKVAVLGSGIMGSGIACHLANAGMQVLMLDLPAKEGPRNGIAAGALELSIKYSKERKAFGTEIANHQAIAFKLADMATEIEAARLFCLKAAWLKDQNKSYSLASAYAKLFAADMAMRVTTEAVQIHGGYGYVREYHVERLMRDAKLTQIYEGTSEIQKIVISRSILQD